MASASQKIDEDSIWRGFVTFDGVSFLVEGIKAGYSLPVCYLLLGKHDLEV